MLALLALLSCFARASGPCDEEGLRKVSSALQSVQRDQRRSLAAMGLDEVCKLPEPLHEGLRAVSGAAPEHASRLAMVAVVDSGPAWEAACPGGAAVLASAAALTPEDRARTVLDHCKPDFATESDRRASDTLPLAILVRAHMESNEKAFRNTVLRALAGM